MIFRINAICLSLLFFLSLFFSIGEINIIDGAEASDNETVVINEVAWMGTASSSHEEWLEFFNLSTSTIDMSDWSVYGADTGECLNFADSDGINSASVAPDDYLLYGNSESIFSNIDIWDASIGLNNSDPSDLKLFDKGDCGEGGGEVINVVETGDSWPAGDSDELLTMERKSDGTWASSLNSGGTPGDINSVIQSGDSLEEETEDQGDDSSTGSASTGTASKPSYNEGDVIINEVVSDPEESETEWVELKNTTGAQINLDGWSLKEAGGSVTSLEGSIDVYKVFDDLKGHLNNDGDKVILKSGDGKVIDEMEYDEHNSPEKGESLARNKEGEWLVTAKKTKGEKNIFKTPSKSSQNDSAQVVITEILPNPEGGDRESEFIEFYNLSDRKIDLTGWRLEVKSGQTYEFGLYDFYKSDKKIGAREYLVLERSESYLPLNNNGDKLKLYKADRKTPIQTIDYKKASAGLSYADSRHINGSSTATGTREFIKNSTRVGQWVWSKAVTPGKANQINTINKAPVVYFSHPEPLRPKENYLFDSSDTFDENGDELKFSWDFGDGVKLTGETVNHIYLKSGEYTLSLSVSDGQVTSTKSKLIKVDNKDSNADRDKKERKDSPGSSSKKENSEEDEKSQNGTGRISAINNFDNTESSNGNYKYVPLAEIKNKDEGSKVTTQGKVAVKPGILGKQYFYIVGSPGVQVYNYYKDFPDLEVGDFVEVKGELTVARGGTRIKTEAREDIRVLGTQNPPEATQYNCGQLSKSMSGGLVKVKGELADKKTNKLYIFDSTGEAQIYIQEETGIDTVDLEQGTRVEVTGIVDVYDDETRIMPRSREDIRILQEKISEEKDETKKENETSDIILPSKEENNNWWKYAFAAVLAGLILAGIIINKQRG